MLTTKFRGLIGIAAAALLAVSSPAGAAPRSDEGASVVIATKIVAAEGAVDSLVQLASVNKSSETHAHCVYVNANSHCSNNGKVCTNSVQCVDGISVGACEAGWIEHNFDVVLTAEQPLAWSAARGLGGASFSADPNELEEGVLPCPGIPFFRQCPSFATGDIDPDQSNAGTFVPPVSESPFIGELKCLQSDERTRRPIGPCGGTGEDVCPLDYLTGSVTIFSYQPDPFEALDAAQYNMIGLKSSGINNGDGVLQIGGTDAEYEPCAKQLVFEHLFDGAADPINGAGRTQTELTLVPCTQDFRTQIVQPVNANFLIYNEFEQRFSTAKRVDCQLDSVISEIDTTQPTRSVFHAAVAGTIAGQTFIDGVGGGLVGTAILKLVGPPTRMSEGSGSGGGSTTILPGSAGYTVLGMSERIVDGDRITIP